MTACGGNAVASAPLGGAQIGGERLKFVTATPLPPTTTPVPTVPPTPTATERPTDTPLPPTETPLPPLPTIPATATRAPVPTAPPGLYAGSGVPAHPATRIVIPALGLDAPVKLSPIVGETWDVSNLEQSVGHLEGTVSPGEAGNTVLAGHITLAPDGHPGPFYRLRGLNPGDVVMVYRDAEMFTYQIDGSATVSPTDVQVAFPTDNTRLTLITCQNYDDSLSEYTNRLVVFGHLVTN